MVRNCLWVVRLSWTFYCTSKKVKVVVLNHVLSLLFVAESNQRYKRKKYYNIAIFNTFAWSFNRMQFDALVHFISAFAVTAIFAYDREKATIHI